MVSVRAPSMRLVKRVCAWRLLTGQGLLPGCFAQYPLIKITVKNSDTSRINLSIQRKLKENINSHIAHYKITSRLYGYRGE